MNILRKGSHGNEFIPIDTLMLQERRIFLGGKIDVEAVNEFEKEILYLNMESSKEPIDVIFSSPQIGWAEGLILADVLQMEGAPIRMYCVGLAKGMAAILFAGGRYGRYMTPHARLQMKLPTQPEDKVIGFALEETKDSKGKRKSLSDMVTSSLIEEYIEANANGLNILEDNISGYDAKSCKQHGLCDQIVHMNRLMSPVSEFMEDLANDGYQEEADEFDGDFWSCA